MKCSTIYFVSNEIQDGRWDNDWKVTPNLEKADNYLKLERKGTNVRVSMELVSLEGGSMCPDLGAYFAMRQPISNRLYPFSMPQTEVIVRGTEQPDSLGKY